MHSLKKLLQNYILENYESRSTLVVSDPSFFERKKKAEIKSVPSVKIASYAPAKVEKKEPVAQPLPTLPIKKVELEPSPLFLKSQAPKVDFSQVYQKIAPGLKLHQAPPSDHLAKGVKNAWKEFPEVPIFVHPSLKGHSELLKALANAIDTKLASSRCCNIDEIKFNNTPPKLIIVPKELLPNYQKLSLEKIPVLFLENLEQYNDSKLKKVLWQQIVQLLQN
jgi:hypothetical protein